VNSWPDGKTRPMKRRAIVGVWMGVVLALLASLLSVSAQVAPAAESASPAWDGTLRRIRVPILMYHYISEPPADADVYRVDLSVPPALFRQHLSYLSDNGYIPITLDDLYAALQTGAVLPARPVILTFDDGYRDNYENAFPLLREFGYTGTFFIMTSGPDANNGDYMTPAQITEMATAGMRMESHTRDHPDLRARDGDFLVYQLLGAQEALTAWTGSAPNQFAYPAGHYDDAVLAMLRSLPIETAVTTDYGALHTNDAALELPRIRIRNTTDVPTLAALLQTDS
jgi:peptidoglycan/xylan/chitin deacetylase (PgdA/CDA1 family)